MLTSKAIYGRLIAAYGQPDWWPGSPCAIMITAILVQNTAWSNVEKTVAELGGTANTGVYRQLDGGRTAAPYPLLRFLSCQGQIYKSLDGMVQGL